MKIKPIIEKFLGKTIEMHGMKAPLPKGVPIAPNQTPKKPRASWEEYALGMAQEAADLRSEDPYIQVGACALRKIDNSIAGIGYNGPPSGVNIDWSNRDERRKRVIHAEVNCLAYVKPNECNLIASTLLPCNDCLKQIARYGIKKVVYKDVYERDDSTLELAHEFGIELIQIKNN